MNGKLQGLTAVVTGGGQGVGFGIARAFADEGANLVLTGRVLDKLESRAEELRRQGVGVVAVAGDVRERTSAKEAVARSLEAFGRIDVLVNNAQIIIPTRSLELQDDDQLDATIRSGLFGTIYFMQEAYPALARQGGSIINLGSMVGVRGDPGSADYSAAKEAIRGVSRVAARDWGKDNIRVNVLCPGAKSESFMDHFPEDWSLAQYEAQLALGRAAECHEDVGKVAAFLASPQCFLTGQTLHVDGGMIMQ